MASRDRCPASDGGKLRNRGFALWHRVCEPRSAISPEEGDAMKKTRQPKRSSKRATEDLKLPTTGRNNAKDVKGGGDSATTSKVTVRDMSVVKVVDKSTPILF
jgi:hypothetical protein